MVVALVKAVTSVALVETVVVEAVALVEARKPDCTRKPLKNSPRSVQTK